MNEPSLTILNRYTLLAPSMDFETAITALAGRVHSEGAAGVLSYRFFVNSDENTARAVIDYADPAAWMAHHDISMNWPEMKALHSVAQLDEIVFLGQVTKDIQDWIAGSPLKATVLAGNSYVAGFRR